MRHIDRAHSLQDFPVPYKSLPQVRNRPLQIARCPTCAAPDFSGRLNMHVMVRKWKSRTRGSARRMIFCLLPT
jgi:hypothetical protein